MKMFPCGCALFELLSSIIHIYLYFNNNNNSLINYKKRTRNYHITKQHTKTISLYETKTFINNAHSK